MIETYAVPAFLSILTLVVIGVTGSNSDNQISVGASQRLLNGIESSKKMTGDCVDVFNSYITALIQSAPPQTIAYLIMAGSYSNLDNLKAVQKQLEEEVGFSKEFLIDLYIHLCAEFGSEPPTPDEDPDDPDDPDDPVFPDPNAGMELRDIIKYGVLSLITGETLRTLLNLFNDFLSGTEDSATEGLFGRVNGTGANLFRWCDLLPTSNAKYSPSNSFKMRFAQDLNMELVEQVVISMNDVRRYNYGWDGVVYSQEYLLQSTISSSKYVFKVNIGKALSPNQYMDIEYDGVTFAFYKLNEDMSIDTTASENCYNLNLDVARLEMQNTLPSYGTNLYRQSNTDPIGFDFLRTVAQTALGADLFPQLPAGYNFSSEGNKYSPTTYPFCDFSKTIPGVYDNQWKSATGAAIIPDFDTFEVYFPQKVPYGNESILNDPSTFQSRVTTSFNKGSVIANPAVEEIPLERIYQPEAVPVSPVEVNPSDLPSEADLTQDLPDVGTPTIPEPEFPPGTDPDSPGSTDPDSPGSTDPDSPGQTDPGTGFPDFGDIPDIELTLDPLLTCFNDFTEKFPFSLPWDLQRIVDSFNGLGDSSEAPVFKFSILGTEVTLDFGFIDAWAQIIRGFVYVEFVICLIFAVRKLTP